jgi:DNA-binding winged helix-turn-helix (wHTH) protein
MSMEAPSPYLELPGFIVDVRRRLLLRRESGEAVALNAKAFDTLLYLAQHPGEVLDKDTLLAAVWPGVVVEENSLAQNISVLRQSLGESHGENRYIATVPRRGYRWVAEVHPRSVLPAALVTPAPAPAGSSPAPARIKLWTTTAAALAVALILGAVWFGRMDRQ